MGSPGLDCWAQGGLYTFDHCCLDVSPEHKGYPRCWQDGYTYDLCCLPEFRSRADEGYELIERGAFQEASDKLFRLLALYATARASFPDYRRAFLGFEKAAMEVRKELDRQPHTLSYFEILFRGLGIDCSEGPPAKRMTVSTPYSEYLHCCVEGSPSAAATYKKRGSFDNSQCNLVHEMMANAIGMRHQTLEERDRYYNNMSELWAFHHFTPSVLADDTTRRQVGQAMPLESARAADPAMAEALLRPGEPKLGIQWARHIDYLSSKFLWGIYHLVLLFGLMRTDGVTGPMDIFELGAGYGSLPRMLALSKRHLLELNPPVELSSYTIFDVRSAINLQRWHLNATAEDFVTLRDWGDLSSGSIGDAVERLFASSRAGGLPAAARHLVMDEGGEGDEGEQGQQPGYRNGSAPLRVNFVDTFARDLFSHLYAEAHSEEPPSLSASSGASAGSSSSSSSRPRPERPVRVLIAVNSWHEFPPQDYLWYYNTFVAAPTWRTGVDWILYVANEEWLQTDAKAALLLEERSHFAFELYREIRVDPTCIRVLRRVK